MKERGEDKYWISFKAIIILYAKIIHNKNCFFLKIWLTFMQAEWNKLIEKIVHLLKWMKLMSIKKNDRKNILKAEYKWK